MRLVAVLATWLVCRAAPAAAQGPLVPHTNWSAFAPPPPLSLPFAGGTAPRLAWRMDSTAIPRTYWLEGGVAGALFVGVVASQLCHLGDETGFCFSVPAFALFGATIGFPAGALLGGQIRKP